MPLKVYGPTMSIATARVLLCLEEVGAPYEQVPLDLAAGEHKSPSFLSKNPFGQVPVLEDGDLMLFESRAIGRYVLRKFKSPDADLLREGNTKEAAMVNVWLEVEAQQYDKAMGPIFAQLVLLPIFFGGTPDEKVVAEHMEKLCKALDVYEERLSRFKYLAGDFLSYADISHIPFTQFFMTSSKASICDSRPHFKAWWERLASRPSSKKIIAAMSAN